MASLPYSPWGRCLGGPLATPAPAYRRRSCPNPRLSRGKNRPPVTAAARPASPRFPQRRVHSSMIPGRARIVLRNGTGVASRKAHFRWRLPCRVDQQSPDVRQRNARLDRHVDRQLQARTAVRVPGGNDLGCEVRRRRQSEAMACERGGQRQPERAVPVGVHQLLQVAGVVAVSGAESCERSLQDAGDHETPPGARGSGYAQIIAANGERRQQRAGLGWPLPSAA